MKKTVIIVLLVALLYPIFLHFAPKNIGQYDEKDIPVFIGDLAAGGQKRQAAMAGLAKIGAPAIKPLFEHIKTADNIVAQAVLVILSRMHPQVLQQNVDFFTQSLQDSDFKVRVLALNSMTPIAKDVLNLGPQVHKMASSDENLAVAIKAVQLLSLQNQDDAYLFSAIENRLPFFLEGVYRNNIHAEFMVLYHWGKKAVPTLIKELETKPQSKFKIIEMLGRVGSKEVVDV